PRRRRRPPAGRPPLDGVLDRSHPSAAPAAPGAPRAGGGRAVRRAPAPAVDGEPAPEDPGRRGLVAEPPAPDDEPLSHGPRRARSRRSAAVDPHARADG